MTFHRRHSHSHDDDAERGGSFLRSTVYLLALGALLTTSWRALERNHQRRSVTRSQPVPEKLQTWEGEGGRPDPDPEPVSPGSSTPPRGL